MTDDSSKGLKRHLCPTEGCWRSFDTEAGLDFHVERGNHDPGAEVADD